MSDDRQRDPESSRDELFDAALDDLFGPGDAGSKPDSDPPRVEVEQAAEPVSVSPPPPQPSTLYPVQRGPGPVSGAKPTRSVGRTIGIGCAAVVAVMFFCLVALTIIGLFADDNTQASQAPAAGGSLVQQRIVYGI